MGNTESKGRSCRGGAHESRGEGRGIALMVGHMEKKDQHNFSISRPKKSFQPMAKLQRESTQRS